MAKPRKCGVPSCEQPAIGLCAWHLRDRAVDEATGQVHEIPKGGLCGLARCAAHMRYGRGGEPRCLWHHEREKREAAA